MTAMTITTPDRSTPQAMAYAFENMRSDLNAFVLGLIADCTQQAAELARVQAERDDLKARLDQTLAALAKAERDAERADRVVEKMQYDIRNAEDDAAFWRKEARA